MLCPVNLPNEVKLAYYAICPLPRPCALWLAGRGEKLLLPPFTPRPYYLGYRDYIILFGIYMSFTRFQYELLVHTPNTDVYRRILECSTLPRPSTLAHVVDVQQFIRSHIARTIYTTLPLLLDFPRRRRAKCKVHTSTSC